MTYTLTNSTGVVRDADSAIIPDDPANVDWQEYVSWIAEGNTPNPYAPPPQHVPQIISDRQFFQQAAISGLITQAEALDAVKVGTIPSVLQAIVDGIPDQSQQFAAQMMLSGATVFERSHPLTEAVGAALGWTSEQINEFFMLASSL